jgi:uncharacterized protein (TIGR02118 family)
MVPMHKLVILIEPMEDTQQFDAKWPEFLNLAENMPGAKQEVICRIDQFLFGAIKIGKVYELFFNSSREAEEAMASPQGQAAGQLLQQMTNGHITIFIADQKQDMIANIRRFLPAKKLTSNKSVD